MVTRTTIRSGIGFSVTRILQAIVDKRYVAALQKGVKNEQRARRLASHLHTKGLIPHDTSKEVYVTRKWSEMDMSGYDLIIPTDLGDIGLQIKSSFYGKKKFEERQRKKSYVRIRCIVVNDKLTDAEIVEKIRRNCWREYNIMKEKMGRMY